MKRLRKLGKDEVGYISEFVNWEWFLEKPLQLENVIDREGKIGFGWKDVKYMGVVEEHANEYMNDEEANDSSWEGQDERELWYDEDMDDEENTAESLSHGS